MQLRDLAFSDLYVCAAPEPGADHWITWFRPRAGEPYRVVQPVPAGCEADIEALRTTLARPPARVFALDHGGVRYRVAQITRGKEPWFALRRCMDEPPAFTVLGVPHKTAADLVALGSHAGLILVTGMPGSGKTTLSAAMLAGFLEDHGDVAVTIEDPPEVPLAGRLGHGLCYQVAVEEGDWAGPLDRIPLYAATYLYIGHLDRPETAVKALQAAQLGMRVLATVTAHEIEDAIQKVGGLASSIEPMSDLILSQTLSAVVHLTLERRLTVRMLTLNHGEQDPVRNLLRARKFDQLRAVIQQQHEQRNAGMRLRA